MKKLEDFKAKKVELKTIYGGKIQAGTCFKYEHSCTVGGPNNGRDDGPGELDD
jgi:hypothetical protein